MTVSKEFWCSPLLFLQQLNIVTSNLVCDENAWFKYLHLPYINKLTGNEYGILLWQTIIFFALWFVSCFLLLISAAAEWMSTTCLSCCTWLAENTGHKKSPQNRHLATITLTLTLTPKCYHWI